MKMKWKNLRPLLSPEDEGGSGGGEADAGETEGSTDGGVSDAGDVAGDVDDSGDTEQQSSEHWLKSHEGIDEDLAKFVGDRSLTDVLNVARQNRQALSKRSDDIVKDLGLVKPLDPEADKDTIKGALASVMPSDPDAYWASTGIAKDKASVRDTMEVEAALGAGIPASLFQDFRETIKTQDEAVNTAAGEGIGRALADQWGADATRNSQIIERTTKQLGLEQFMEQFPKPSTGVEASQYIEVMNGLVKIGEMLSEGGGVEQTSQGAGSIDDQITALEENIGSIMQKGDTVPESQRQKLTSLLHKRAEQKMGVAQ